MKNSSEKERKEWMEKRAKCGAWNKIYYHSMME
jgi:hypothetical protein